MAVIGHLPERLRPGSQGASRQAPATERGTQRKSHSLTTPDHCACTMPISPRCREAHQTADSSCLDQLCTSASVHPQTISFCFLRCASLQSSARWLGSMMSPDPARAGPTVQCPGTTQACRYGRELHGGDQAIRPTSTSIRRLRLSAVVPPGAPKRNKRAHSVRTRLLTVEIIEYRFYNGIRMTAMGSALGIAV